MPGIRKSLVFRKIHTFVNRKFIDDHIHDIHVNIIVLTTELLIPSGTKLPPAGASTQWWT